MARRICALLAIPLQAVLSVVAAHAMDVGNPVFAPDTSWTAQSEVRYEQYDRSFTYRNVGNTSPVDIEPLDVTRDMRLSLYGARFYFPTSDRTMAYLELGYFEGRGMSAEGMFVGAGADLFAVRFAGLQSRLYAAIGYVPELDYSDSSGLFREAYSEQWVELSLGATVTRNFRVKKGWTIAPYVGVTASLVRGDGDITRSFVLSDEEFAVRKDSYQIEEDETFFGLLGCSLFLGNQLSLRAEWHLFPGDTPSSLEDESLSLALGYAF